MKPFATHSARIAAMSVAMIVVAVGAAVIISRSDEGAAVAARAPAVPREETPVEPKEEPTPDQHALDLAVRGADLNAGAVSAYLAARFPDSFGGLWVNSTDRLDYRVVTVGAADAMKVAVSTLLAEAPGAGPKPTVTYAKGTHPLKDLRAAVDGITSERWQRGLPIVSVGVDEARNGLVVSVEGPSAGVQEDLAARYGVRILSVEGGASVPVAGTG